MFLDLPFYLSQIVGKEPWRVGTSRFLLNFKPKEYSSSCSDVLVLFALRGVAILEYLCNSVTGFGLSAGIVGNFESIDAGTLWDFIVVSHEFGE